MIAIMSRELVEALRTPPAREGSFPARAFAFRRGERVSAPHLVEADIDGGGNLRITVRLPAARPRAASPRRQ